MKPQNRSWVKAACFSGIPLFLFLLASGSAPAFADVEKGRQAVEDGDYQTALAEFQKDAAEGNADAQFCLAHLYDDDEGLSPDYQEAFRWYLKAAEQGYAKAQFSLGLMYNEGKGVSRNYTEAIVWYRQAAAHGDTRAKNRLGMLHANGMGVPRDFVAADMWWILAAAQGDLAADKNRITVEQQMSAAEIGEAQKLANEWRSVFEIKTGI